MILSPAPPPGCSTSQRNITTRKHLQQRFGAIYERVLLGNYNMRAELRAINESI
ncbi:MAG: hypothetical protein KKH22_04475 [Proteobacteria bacterium]|nr:hypothetical protein [Pseudomonadota bacterium]